MTPVTVVMYHYVRELKKSRFPNIKGLELDLFRGQLAYLRDHYTLVSADDCLDALELGKRLPGNAALLTFDDGYIDHYMSVFPILQKAGIPACFFPSGQAIAERKVLDVNKIHFILANTKDANALVTAVFVQLDSYRDEYQLPPNESFIQRFAVANRFDSKEVVLIKRLLQTELPLVLRSRIVHSLFEQYVSGDEAAFANELYMSLDQLRHMVRSGMTVGSHAWTHRWMDSQTYDEQEKEIDLSLEFLKSIGVSCPRWTMAYPYGIYNQDTLDILRQKNCRMAFTTDVEIADLAPDQALLLPRLDTNDLPKDAKATPNSWTQRVTTNGAAKESFV